MMFIVSKARSEICSLILFVCQGGYVFTSVYLFGLLAGLSAGSHKKLLSQFPPNLDGGWVSAKRLYVTACWNLHVLTFLIGYIRVDCKMTWKWDLPRLCCLMLRNFRFLCEEPRVGFSATDHQTWLCAHSRVPWLGAFLCSANRVPEWI